MTQQSFSDYEYSCRKKKTKREEFLDIMEDIIPWNEWIEFIRPYYPSGKRGRPVKGIEKMLRMYLLQVWFNLSDEGIEDAIYDSYAFRKFMGINFTEEQVPDATTLLKFRHLLEKNHIGEQMFKAINYVLEQGGAMMKGVKTMKWFTEIQDTSEFRSVLRLQRMNILKTLIFAL